MSMSRCSQSRHCHVHVNICLIHHWLNKYIERWIEFILLDFMQLHCKVWSWLNFGFYSSMTTFSKHPRHFHHLKFPADYYVWLALCLIPQVSPILTNETPEFYNPPTLTDRDSTLEKMFVIKVDFCLVVAISLFTQRSPVSNALLPVKVTEKVHYIVSVEMTIDIPVSLPSLCNLFGSVGVPRSHF